MSKTLVQTTNIKASKKPMSTQLSVATPIWQRIQQRVAEVPAAELDVLPRDGAEQHDHYLYDSPKKAAS